METSLWYFPMSPENVMWGSFRVTILEIILLSLPITQRLTTEIFRYSDLAEFVGRDVNQGAEASVLITLVLVECYFETKLQVSSVERSHLSFCFGLSCILPKFIC